jgi:hypothetical protein
MGDKGKGKDTGKTQKTKATKPGKHGLRPDEERARDERMVKKPS